MLPIFAGIMRETDSQKFSILPAPGLAENGVLFLPYRSRVPVHQGMARLKMHMISLITAGEKVIHVGNGEVQVTPGRILLLAAGNYLYTERLKPGEEVRSTIIYFDAGLLEAVPDQHWGLNALASPFALFEQDDYIRHYIDSVNLLLSGHDFNNAMQRAKVVELLIYLSARYPGIMDGWQHKKNNAGEQHLQLIIESPAAHTLSVGELAFLCNMSLATFKRKFRAVYNSSPAAWLQVRRLEAAAALLKTRQAKPAEVYLLYGYENHSSFSKAFKQHFGILPKDFGK